MAYLDVNTNCDTRPVCTITNGSYSYVLAVDDETINFNGCCNAEYFYRHYHKLGYNVKAVGWTPPSTEGLPVEQRVFKPVVLTARFTHPDSLPEALTVEQLAAIFGDGKQLAPFIQNRREGARPQISAVTTFGRLAVMPVGYLNFFHPLKP